MTIFGGRGGGIFRLSSGGFWSTVGLSNSIVALNTGGDCEGNIPSGTSIIPIYSFGYNLDSDDTCHLTETGDQPGVTSSSLNLSVLGRFGTVNTPVHIPLAGSVAHDAGDPYGSCESIDQHGNVRPYDEDGDGLAICDIGAYELGITIYQKLPEEY
jgi:hypothetical protein